MSLRRASFKQADASRALRAAVAAGLKPLGYTIAADGSISVQLSEGDGFQNNNSFDRIMGQSR